jgi:hypothetical protein
LQRCRQNSPRLITLELAEKEADVLIQKHLSRPDIARCQEYIPGKHCSVCLNAVPNVVLPCSHKFCSTCVLQMTKQVNFIPDKRKCPECRSPFLDYVLINIH